MIRVSARMAVLAAMGLTATSSEAANFVCIASPVVYLGSSGDGTVFTAIDGKVVGICNLTTATGPVAPQACTAWFSALLTQRTLGKTVTLHFDNANLSGCAAIGTWTIAVPYFFIQN